MSVVIGRGRDRLRGYTARVPTRERVSDGDELLERDEGSEGGRSESARGSGAGA